MEQLMLTMLIAAIWILIGAACIALWEDAFDDIKSRVFRVGARFLMLVLWPAWLAIWVVCVAIGIAIMLLKDLFK